MIDNIFAPFSLTFHAIFCIFATILYSVQFYRKSYKHYFYLILAIDLTILTQFYTEKFFITCLGIAEIILLIMIFISMFKVSRRNKKLEIEKKAQQTAIPEEKNDIVGDAFSDEK